MVVSFIFADQFSYPWSVLTINHSMNSLLTFLSPNARDIHWSINLSSVILRKHMDLIRKESLFLPGQISPLGIHPLRQTPPWADTPSDRDPPLQTATAAHVTHPTGMHSCYVNYCWIFSRMWGKISCGANLRFPFVQKSCYMNIQVSFSCLFLFSWVCYLQERTVFY